MDFGQAVQRASQTFLDMEFKHNIIYCIYIYFQHLTSHVIHVP